MPIRQTLIGSVGYISTIVAKFTPSVPIGHMYGECDKREAEHDSFDSLQ